LQEYVGGAGGAATGGSAGLAQVGGSGAMSGQVGLGGSAATAGLGGTDERGGTGGVAGSEGGSDNGGTQEMGGGSGDENGGDGPVAAQGGTTGGAAGSAGGGMGGSMGGISGGGGDGGVGGRGGRGGAGAGGAGMAGMAGMAGGGGMGGCGEVDLTTDPEHCGSCENACESNEECLDGYCAASPCDGLCTITSTVTLAPGQGYKRDNIGGGEVCAEVIGYDPVNPPSIVCWNFTTPTTLELNETTINCQISTGQEFDVPPRMGGYCVHVLPGTQTFRGFEFPD